MGTPSIRSLFDRPGTTRSALETWIGDASTWHLVVTALVACAAQLVVLSQKDVLILEWRPTDLAAIALNYYRNGFDFLHPQILWGGSGPGYVEMECPLIPFGIALLYTVFGVHDWVALVIPMAFGIGLAIVMNVCTRRFFGAAAGLVAGLFVATSPAWLAMSTGVWPDVPPIFFGALGLCLLARWVDDRRQARFVLAACCLSLAILLKLTSLYLGLPVAFLFWLTDRRSWWRSRHAWIFAIVVLVPPTLWYAHAYRLFLEYHNTFGIIASGYMKFGDVDILTDPRFYARTFILLMLFHATPFGFLLTAIGTVGRSERAAGYLFHVWLGAVLVYLLIAAEGVSLGHYQYALPIVPPSAALAGRGLVMLTRAVESHPRMSIRSVGQWVGIGVVALFATSTALANYVYDTRGTASSRQSVLKMRTGKAVARLTAPGSLIVVVDARMDDRTPETSMTPPEVFYFGDRRGWYRSMAWLSADSIEDLRRQGARYLTVSANYVDWFREHYGELYRHCSGLYRTLLDNDEGIIYELTTQ